MKGERLCSLGLWGEEPAGLPGPRQSSSRELLPDTPGKRSPLPPLGDWDGVAASSKKLFETCSKQTRPTMMIFYFEVVYIWIPSCWKAACIPFHTDIDGRSAEDGQKSCPQRVASQKGERGNFLSTWGGAGSFCTPILLPMGSILGGLEQSPERSCLKSRDLKIEHPNHQECRNNIKNPSCWTYFSRRSRRSKKWDDLDVANWHNLCFSTKWMFQSDTLKTWPFWLSSLPHLPPLFHSGGSDTVWAGQLGPYPNLGGILTMSLRWLRARIRRGDQLQSSLPLE